MLYVLGNVLDLITTFLLSPDLERENNVMIARYGFGWHYMLLSALVTSIAMFGAQSWVWIRLFQRFPTTPLGYRQFYHGVFYGRSYLRDTERKRFTTGILIGLVSITASALIASKLLTGLWNLMILAIDLRTDSFLLTMFIKNLLAGCVGLISFFVYPYRLHRSMHSAIEVHQLS